MRVSIGSHVSPLSTWNAHEEGRCPGAFVACLRHATCPQIDPLRPFLLDQRFLAASGSSPSTASPDRLQPSQTVRSRVIAAWTRNRNRFPLEESFTLENAPRAEDDQFAATPIFERSRWR